MCSADFQVLQKKHLKMFCPGILAPPETVASWKYMAYSKSNSKYHPYQTAKRN